MINGIRVFLHSFYSPHKTRTNAATLAGSISVMISSSDHCGSPILVLRHIYLRLPITALSPTEFMALSQPCSRNFPLLGNYHHHCQKLFHLRPLTVYQQTYRSVFYRIRSLCEKLKTGLSSSLTSLKVS